MSLTVNEQVEEGKGEGEGEDDEANESYLKEEEEEEEEAEIENEVDLLTFIQTLQDAQRAAQEEEKQKRAKTKRPRFYTGNSKRSMARYAAKRQKIVQEGKQKFITDHFKKKNCRDVSLSYSPDKEPGPDGAEIEDLHIEEMDLMNEIQEEEMVDKEAESSTVGNSDQELIQGPSVKQSQKATLTMHEKLQDMLCSYGDYSIESSSDIAVGSMDYCDFPALQQACAKLTVKDKDPKVDVFLKA
ncbi:hypothetical protein BU17DRAFT_96555 [Hysterangium stoloniferum]|nr:hypothetical protein BU17DRAFT_96555 [Hysterangium stoloniferum]